MDLSPETLPTYVRTVTPTPTPSRNLLMFDDHDVLFSQIDYPTFIIHALASLTGTSVLSDSH
jgi:hypothetical protein